MYFSKEKFLKHATRVDKADLPSSHIDALDGKEFINNQVDYEVDGQEWYLYPIKEEWLTETLPGQITIDDWLGGTK